MRREGEGDADAVDAAFDEPPPCGPRPAGSPRHANGQLLLSKAAPESPQAADCHATSPTWLHRYADFDTARVEL